ncbi:MAG: hypothetical protein MJ231_00260 [bacterium]|nr:hypothetical protein [bacterium]
MDSISISMFRNLEQQAMRNYNAHEVAHKNAVKLIVANKFFTAKISETPENPETAENVENQPTSYRLNYLA